MPAMLCLIQQGFTAKIRRARALLLPALSWLLLLGMVESAYGFGANAHLIAGQIAERHLCANSRAALNELSPDKHLPEAGLWADKIRSNPAYDYAKPWHYINIPDDQPLSAARRSGKGDVLAAIEDFYARLGNESLPEDQRREALWFLAHFVVDIHQPLHVGREEDRGGNSIKVRVNGEAMNLHSYWDTGVLKNRVDSAYAYAAGLDAASYASVAVWQASSPRVWLAESQALRPEVYSFGLAPRGAPVLLDEPYQRRAARIVDLRLAQAGIRLADLLNRLWCPADPVK
jgi:hypothetical protein